MRINNTELKIIKGDIAQFKSDAIVSEEAYKNGSIEIGSAIETKTTNLPAKYLIRAVTMDSNSKTDEVKIRSTCRNALEVAKRLQLKSIAFPALGCSVGSFTTKASAKIMAQEILRHAKYDANPLGEIIFVLSNDTTFDEFNKIATSYLDYMQHKLSQCPFITVDIIIEVADGVVLIERSNPPFGWAIPGGFLDYGETLENCAIREAKEETNLDIYDLEQMHTYSDPKRDPRFHTVTAVFVAKAKGKPKAGDDAQNAKVFKLKDIPNLKLAFDHNDVLEDYKKFKQKNND